jgi:hypothetical protein
LHGDAHDGRAVYQQFGLICASAASAATCQPAQATSEGLSRFRQGFSGQGHVDLVEGQLNGLLATALDAAQYYPSHIYCQPLQIASQHTSIVCLIPGATAGQIDMHNVVHLGASNKVCGVNIPASSDVPGAWSYRLHCLADGIDVGGHGPEELGGIA